MRPTTRKGCIAATLVCVLLAGGQAEADPDRVLVIPFAGRVPGSADGATRFTQVTARVAGLTGGDITVSEVTLDDALALVGCVKETATCMAKLARTLEADVVAIGSIRRREPGVEVTVKVFKDGAITQASYPVVVDDLDATVEELARKLPELFLSRSGVSPEPAKTEPAKTEPAKTEPAKTEPAKTEPAKTEPAKTEPSGPRGDGEESGGIGWAPWLVIGAGVVIAGVGGGFLFRASDRQDQVNAAPIRTAADLERLEALEDEGEGYTRIGNALTIAGGVVLAAGVTWIVFRARAGPREVSVSPVPVRGGAAVLVEVRVP